jgi:hypothetical protein
MIENVKQTRAASWRAGYWQRSHLRNHLDDFLTLLSNQVCFPVLSDIPENLQAQFIEGHLSIGTYYVKRPVSGKSIGPTSIYLNIDAVPNETEILNQYRFDSLYAKLGALEGLTYLEWRRGKNIQESAVLTVAAQGGVKAGPAGGVAGKASISGSKTTQTGQRNAAVRMIECEGKIRTDGFQITAHARDY